MKDPSYYLEDIKMRKNKNLLYIFGPIEKTSSPDAFYSILEFTSYIPYHYQLLTKSLKF